MMIPHFRGVATQRACGGNNSGHNNPLHCNMASESSGSLDPFCSDDPPSSNPKRRQTKRFLGAGMICFAVIGFLMLMDFRWHLLHSSTYDERHPLRPRKGLRHSPSTNEVRYLAFGGSSTWGSGLKHPNSESYPYLLSTAAHNAAVRSGKYTLAAACTQTIVQDDVYDVILIEFSVFDDSIAVLTRRLRARFPSASIFFVRLWHPSQMKFRQDDGSTLDFVKFRQQLGNPSLDDAVLYFEMLKSGADRWFIDIPEQETEIKMAAAQVQARYLKLPVPESDVFAYPITMRKTMELFEDDDLSKHGHFVIAESIRSHVRENQVLLGPDRDKVGTWGNGDQCNLWYNNGDYELSGRRLRAIEFDHAGDDHRHALEVSSAGSSFDIENPFNEDRMLYLTYMTSAMDNDDEMRSPYPDIRVSLNGKSTVMVEPYHVGSKYVEYARTSAVGKVPPGTSTVNLLPAGRGRRNFRLVGASFLPSDVVRELPTLEFDLESESQDVLSSIFQWF